MNSTFKFLCRVLLGAGAILLAGCAHHVLNEPKSASGQSNGGYYFHAHQATNNSSELLVMLAFSGGGTRAAAFSYGVLEELRNTKVFVNGAERSLLQEVDAISSVSGGSVTAAAYGLYGEKIFDVLPDAFLNRNVQRDLLFRTLNPFRWPKLWSTTYGRSELAADYYDKILFKGAKFADLQHDGRPFLVINGTDITSGARFDFTQYAFDLIGSDISSYPVSYAVAASSAVPGALTPITLRNFSTNSHPVLPDWVPEAKKTRSVLLSRRATELETFADGQHNPFLHIVDGGVSDNLGLSPLTDYLQSLPYSPRKQDEVKSMLPKKLVLIAVNAYSSPDKDWDTKESPPGSISTAAAAATHTLAHNSWKTLDRVRELFVRWQTEHPNYADVKLYPIYLSFTNFRDQSDQRFFLNLPTSFFLPAANVEKLREAGHQLLHENQYFNELLHDLSATPGAAAPPAEH